jgi:sensor histidine kinase YesM
MKYILKLAEIFFLEDLYFFLDYWFNHLLKNVLRKTIEYIYFLDHDLGFRRNLRNLFSPLIFEKGILSFLIGRPVGFILRFFLIFFLSIIYTLIFSFSFILIIFIFILPIFLLILSLPKTNGIFMGK